MQFADPDEADAKEKKKQASESAKAKVKEEKETAKKKAKACGGRVKRGAKAGAVDDEDEMDEFVVKIQDPKLALLLSRKGETIPERIEYQSLTVLTMCSNPVFLSCSSCSAAAAVVNTRRRRR